MYIAPRLPAGRQAHSVSLLKTRRASPFGGSAWLGVWIES